MADIAALVDAHFFADRIEQPVARARCLGAAEKQITGVTQREMKHEHDPLLHFGFEINQQIATGAQIDTRERRIAQQVMGCEHD